MYLYYNSQLRYKTSFCKTFFKFKIIALEMTWNDILLRLNKHSLTTSFSLGICIGLLIPYLGYQYKEMLKNKRKIEYLIKIKKKNPTCLVCGGAGYIGSHTAVSLLEAGYDVVIVDNLSNSKKDVIDRIKNVTKCESNRISFFHVDMCNYHDLETVFLKAGPFDSCIHLAGYKAVGESVLQPVKYFENNIVSTINLLKLLEKYKCNSLVFSSSATVYGTYNSCPFDELSITGLGITNAYARTKHMIEGILQDFFLSKKKEYTGSENPWSIITLRYFNPVGAHETGLLGENPNGTPNNLLPFITQVLQGKREKLSVYGNDYPTHDGPCLREYIHVMDLAEGHVAALKYSTDKTRLRGEGAYEVFNLGSGEGHSVFEMLRAMENASGLKIPFRIEPRRPGDIAASYASVKKAYNNMRWKTKRNLETICKDTWKWVQSSGKEKMI